MNKRALAVALVAALLGLSWGLGENEPPLQPPPTEHWLDNGAESDNKSRRKAWIQERRRAGPGIDVAAIERANGLAQTRLRNALAVAPPAICGPHGMGEGACT
jgi:hypothetical protein